MTNERFQKTIGGSPVCVTWTSTSTITQAIPTTVEVYTTLVTTAYETTDVYTTLSYPETAYVRAKQTGAWEQSALLRMGKETRELKPWIVL